MVTINIPACYWEEDGSFVTYTPAFEVASSGDTIVEAKEMLKEAIALFIETHLAFNTLDEALLDLGWRKINSKWNPASNPASQEQSIEVQIPVC